MGTTIPQRTNIRPDYFISFQKNNPVLYRGLAFLGIYNIFTSWWFLLTIFLLSISLAISISIQLKKAIAIYYRQKNQFVFGNTIFHGGLLVLLVSAFFTFSFKQWGFVQLIEGDTFTGHSCDFTTTDYGPLVGEFEVGYSVALEHFSHHYWDTGEIKELKSQIIVYRPAVPLSRLTITRESPVQVGGVEIYQSSFYGYTVKVELIRGKQVIPTYYSLDMKTDGPLRGKSFFPTTNYLLEMTYYPDYRGKSAYPVDSLLMIKFFQSGKEVARALLRLGEEVQVQENLFRFAEVRNWSGLIFTKDPFRVPILTGFVLVVFGIFLTFFASKEFLQGESHGL